jgi:lipoprotein-anchoring transpeptidase ErfK/SrfK
MRIAQKILGSAAAISMFAASAAMAQGYSPAYPPPADVPVYSSAPTYAPAPTYVAPPPPVYPQAVRAVPGGQPEFDQLSDDPPSVALPPPGLPNDPRYAAPPRPLSADRPLVDGFIYPEQDQRVDRTTPDSQPVNLDPPRPPGAVDSAPVGSTASSGAPAGGIYAALPPEERPEVGKVDLPARLKRQEVRFSTKEPAGTIVVDTQNTYLYYVLGGGRAVRYGVRVGRDGFTWNGTQKITRKAEWPDWHPPTEMIERQPYLPRFMAGGDGNPLGARAMYLGNTVYRIHGTNQPSTIGKFVSSGCIGMLNEDVIDLFDRAKVGTRVVVLPAAVPPALASAAPTQPMPNQASNVNAAAPGQPLPPMGAPITVR